MKKICLIVFFLITTGFASYAQEADEDTYGVKRIFLDRIYEHSRGFIVTYGDEHNVHNEIPLPIDWFGNTYASFAYVHQYQGKATPFMVLRFRNGNLEHIHLYIPHHSHPAYRTLRNFEEVQAIFDVEPEDLVF